MPTCEMVVTCKQAPIRKLWVLSKFTMAVALTSIQMGQLSSRTFKFIEARRLPALNHTPHPPKPLTKYQILLQTTYTELFSKAAYRIPNPPPKPLTEYRIPLFLKPFSDYRNPLPKLPTEYRFFQPPTKRKQGYWNFKCNSPIETHVIVTYYLPKAIRNSSSP